VVSTRRANAGIVWVSTPGDYATLNSNHTPDGTDGKVTLTGSMNWTGSAAHNSENLNLVASPTIAAAYAAHWNQRLALSSPYKQREDWCRSQEPVGVKSESSPR
jgi:hypothetical protein